MLTTTTTARSTTKGHGDHDGDDGEPDETAEVPVTKTCYDTRPVIKDADGEYFQPGTGGDARADRTTGSVPETDTATVQWAEWAGLGPSDSSVDYIIQEFDKDTNTIFVATVTNDEVDTGSAIVVSYDSNDRYNNEDDASTYAGFEKAS